MDWSSIITTLLGIVFGGGIAAVVTIRSAKTKAEAEAQTAKDEVWKGRIDDLLKEIEHERNARHEECEKHKADMDFERKRNHDLMEQNIEKEERFRKQTDRLRETQDRELKANARVVELTAENGELRVKEARYHCDVIECPWCQPPKNTTLPKPQGMTIEEWHMNRLKQMYDGNADNN